MTTHALNDTVVLTRRSLRHILRSPDTIITTAITPIAMLLLFVYVFGGAINVGGGDYVNYLLPGILLITVASGVVHLDDEMSFLNFYVVKNEATKIDDTDDFDRYCELRDSTKAFYIYKGCQRRWMNLSNEERKTSGIQILWPVTDNAHFRGALEDAAVGLSPNNISAVVKYSVENGPSLLWMGDLETDFMESVEDGW